MPTIDVALQRVSVVSSRPFASDLDTKVVALLERAAQ